MDKGKGKKVLDTDDKDLDDYFAQYFDPAHTISAAPAINPSALLGPKEFGPSLPSQAGRTLTLKAQECEGGVPYPAGYTRTVPSVDILPTTSGPSRPGAASSASSYTAAKVEEKKRTSYAVGSSNDPLDKLKYRKATVLRQGGGMTWEDESLLEWDESEYYVVKLSMLRLIATDR